MDGRFLYLLEPPLSERLCYLCGPSDHLRTLGAMPVPPITNRIPFRRPKPTIAPAGDCHPASRPTLESRRRAAAPVSGSDHHVARANPRVRSHRGPATGRWLEAPNALNQSNHPVPLPFPARAPAAAVVAGGGPRARPTVSVAFVCSSPAAVLRAEMDLSTTLKSPSCFPK